MEAGTIAAPPTVVNAVLDALRALGVAHLDMPLTPCAYLAGDPGDRPATLRAAGGYECSPERDGLFDQKLLPGRVTHWLVSSLYTFGISLGFDHVIADATSLGIGVGWKNRA